MSDILLTEQTSASATPAAGRVVIYPKNDGYLYFKNDTGMETRVNPQTVATAAEWVAANTILAAGVFGVASDTGNFKIGDGTTAWNSLAYWRYTAEHITIATTGGNTVLTIPQSRASSMAVTGALTSNVTITTPDVMALFVAENLTTGAFTVTFKTAAGSGVEIVQGTHATLYADGVSVENPTTGGVGSGDVVGPTSSTNNRIATFNGATGKIIKDSGMLLSDLATSAQGTLAGTALQPAAIGTTVQAYDADLTTWAGVTPGTGVATFLATPTLANLNTALSDADVVAAATLGVANGVATLDANALIPITQLPPAALERLVVVANQTARYALTTASVQNGDTVKQTDTGEMWYVVDQTNLTNSAGYAVYTAGTASAVAIGGVTGLGTGIATALAIAIGSAGAPVVNGGALGTPVSGVLDNCTSNTEAANNNSTQLATTAYADRLTAGTLAGAFTTLSASPSGITNPVKLGQLSNATAYGLIQFGTGTTDANCMGLYGLQTDQLYYNVPTGATHVFNINGATIANLTSTVFTAKNIDVSAVLTSSATVGMGGDGGGGLFINGGTAGNVVLGVNSVAYVIASSTALTVTGQVSPSAHNTYDLGTTGVRWKDLWLQSGAFNGSDARLKTAITPLSANEINAAKQLSKEIGTYQWLESVQKKGNAARHHVGFTVQRAIEILQLNGCDPFAYGFIGYDKWDDVFVEHAEILPVEAIAAKEAVLDADGNEIEPAIAAVKAVEGKAAWTEHKTVAGDAYSFRYDQLNMFIAAGLEARLAALEAK